MIKKILTVGFTLLLLRGCVALVGAIAADEEPGQKTKPEKIAEIKSPWKWSIASHREAGAKIQGPPDFEGKTETMEAAGKWLVVMMRLQNASTIRQKADGTFVLTTAEITDIDGKVHEVDMNASDIAGESLEGKPFNPGESRSVKLVFDIPQATKPQSITILGWDEQKEAQRFVTKFK